MAQTRWTIALLLVGVTGCSGPAKIEIEPDRPLLTGLKDTVQLRATVRDKGGSVLTTATVTWKTMTPTIASVDASGNVSPVTSGTATILAECGKVTKEVEVIVVVPKKIIIQPESPMLMMGLTKGFKATVMSDRDQPIFVGEMRWSTSDPEIFTVDKNGNVKSIKEGKATLTVHAGGIAGSTEITVKHEELHEDGSLSQ
jgi:uncharacterized protein YjdB